MPITVTATPNLEVATHTMTLQQLEEEIFGRVLAEPHVAVRSDLLIVLGEQNDLPTQLEIRVELRDQKLYLDIERLVINQYDYTLSSLRVDLEEEINAQFAHLQLGQRVTGVALTRAGLELQVQGRRSVEIPLENLSLLERAESNSMNAPSRRFSFFSTLQISTQGETGGITAIGEGFFRDFDDLQRAQFEVIVEVSSELEQYNFILEERLLDQVFYLRMTRLDAGICTRWIAIPFSALFDTVFSLIDQIVPASDFLPDALSFDIPDPRPLPETEPDNALLAMLQLLQFGEYAQTERLDSTGNEARFQTQVALDEFLASQEHVTALVTVISRLGGLSQAERMSANVAVMWTFMRPIVLPQTNLTVNRYVDLQAEIISRADLTFEATFYPLEAETLLSLPRSAARESVDVLVGTTVHFSEYGGDFRTEAPEDVLSITDLNALASVSQSDLLSENCAA